MADDHPDQILGSLGRGVLLAGNEDGCDGGEEGVLPSVPAHGGHRFRRLRDRRRMARRQARMAVLNQEIDEVMRSQDDFFVVHTEDVVGAGLGVRAGGAGAADPVDLRHIVRHVGTRAGSPRREVPAPERARWYVSWRSGCHRSGCCCTRCLRRT